MDTSNMKNIVVLKNLPSNIVEEAIVILKSNAKVKNINKKKENVKVVAKGKTNSKKKVRKSKKINGFFCSNCSICNCCKFNLKQFA